MKEIVLATANEGKIKEMRDILSPYRIKALTLEDFSSVVDPVEKGDTFYENASIKAATYSKLTGRACLADDSGLEVDLLKGAPGIHSSRYAGEGATDDENMVELVRVLSSKPGPWHASFVCCAVYAEEGKLIASHEGRLVGEIVPHRRGGSGFGYDPIFFLPGRGKTVAEISMGEKNRISHRRKAIEGLLLKLIEMEIIEI